LRVELRLRVFEIRVLRIIFWPKREEVIGEWRKLHNEEFSDLYSSLTVIKKNETGWVCSRYEERRGAYRVVVGKHDRKRPLGRPRRWWENNIKIDLQKMGCGSMDWMDLAQDRDRWRALANAAMNLPAP
jgi:hypothetical protein